MGNLCNRQDRIMHKRIMVDLGLLKWKSVAAEHDRSGQPEKFRKVDPHCEEPLLGRNAHSARYGELIHDRTGKLVSVHHQELTYFENFVMGSDAAEFVNKAKDPVRNRQKRMSIIAENCTEHSIIWRMLREAKRSEASPKTLCWSGGEGRT